MSGTTQAADVFAHFKAAEAEPKPAATIPPIKVLNTSDWPNTIPPDPRWLMPELLAAGESGILAGRSNCGKGLLTLQIAVGLASGWGVFNGLGAGDARGVVFVEMEDSPEEQHRRFKRLLDWWRLSPDWTQDHEACLARNFALMVPDWKSEQGKTLPSILPNILAECAKQKTLGVETGLIVLDTLAALSEGDENAVESQRGLWPACYELRDATGACVLLVHHTRKLTSQGKPLRLHDRLAFDSLRGSSAIVGGARFVGQMEALTAAEAAKLNLDEEKAQRGGYVALGMTKVVSGPKGGALLLEQRDGVGGGFWEIHPDSDRLMAELQSPAAAAKLTLVESVLQSIGLGLTDRKLLAQRHWPHELEAKAAANLKAVMNHLRNRHHWIEPGLSMALTDAGKRQLKKLKHAEQPSGDDADDRD
ncbi:MAG TPA: AAA family ATPase [Holophaga sp.]|nr:AAA family ATPase [Holophaga sp.]